MDTSKDERIRELEEENARLRRKLWGIEIARERRRRERDMSVTSQEWILKIDPRDPAPIARFR